MSLPSLPIDEVVPQALSALRNEKGLVLSAPPGTGKTTRFPARMLEENATDRQRILLIEPRRVAARAAARRIALERDSSVGAEVGYHVRLDRRVGRDTRLVAMTPGILLRQLLQDPFLEGIGCVLFDEAHERGLESDLAMAMVHLAKSTVRPDLAIGILSATLETERFTKWLGAPLVKATAPIFPVDTRYSPLAKDRPWMDQVARQVRLATTEAKGDILVFLPGVGEIRRLEKLLLGQVDWDVFPLHGELEPERQDLALSQGNRPRIVLATNVAESSVTVEGVRMVIDTGLARTLIHDPATGLDRLELSEISRASADQRAGRAGRQGPGDCVRLWSLENHKSRDERTTPEILKIDLSGALLSLLEWGGCPVDELPWVEPPPVASMARARATLDSLGAIKDQGLTPTGSRMAKMPLHPRLARMLIEATNQGAACEGAIAAALLTERNPFGRQVRTGVDFFQEIDTLRLHSGFPGAMDHGLDLSRADAQYFDRVAGMFLAQADIREAPSRENWEEGLARAMIAGFPDRVAKLREGNRKRALMVGARGIRLEEDLPGRGDLFLALDLEDSQVETRARKFLPLEWAWLPKELISDSVQIAWNAEKTEIQARKQTRFLDLILKEHSVAPDDPVEVARLLGQRAWEKREDLLPTSDSPPGQFLIRLAFLKKQCPELDLPDPDEAFLKEAIEELALKAKSLEQIKEGPWLEVFHGKLEWNQKQTLDAEAPARMTLPNHRTAAVEYHLDRPPVLGARIQDFFGWDETPKIAKKRVKLLLHLLAPSGRPQQITDDLHGFWRGSYALVRKEMKGRYPRHSWPEDPWNSEPIIRPPRGGRPN